MQFSTKIILLLSNDSSLIKYEDIKNYNIHIYKVCICHRPFSKSKKLECNGMFQYRYFVILQRLVLLININIVSIVKFKCGYGMNWIEETTSEIVNYAFVIVRKAVVIFVTVAAYFFYQLYQCTNCKGHQI